MLAEMAVRQTRHHFLKDGGVIVDNPEVGVALRDQYWRPGNSESFRDLVAKLTGAPLTGAAWVADLKKPLEALIRSEKAEYDAFLRPGGGEGGGGEGGGDKVELEMRVTLVDGDEVIADSERDGSFENMCHTFREFVAKRVNASKE